MSSSRDGQLGDFQWVFCAAILGSFALPSRDAQLSNWGVAVLLGRSMGYTLLAAILLLSVVRRSFRVFELMRGKLKGGRLSVSRSLAKVCVCQWVFPHFLIDL